MKKILSNFLYIVRWGIFALSLFMVGTLLYGDLGITIDGAFEVLIFVLILAVPFGFFLLVYKDLDFLKKRNNLYKYLETKTWYRSFKVIGISVIVLSFFAPLVSEEDLIGIVGTGLINILIWSIVFLIARKAIIYILYGKNLEKLEGFDQNKYKA